MEGFLSCCEGDISPEDVEKWTDNLSNLRSSGRGRDKFRNYLQERNMEKGLEGLKFLEMCDNFLNNTRDAEENKEKLIEEARQIVKFARTHINFNSAEMEDLENGVKTRETEQMRRVIEKAQGNAKQMLANNEYIEFSKNLLKSLKDKK